MSITTPAPVHNSLDSDNDDDEDDHHDDDEDDDDKGFWLKLQTRIITFICSRHMCDPCNCTKITNTRIICWLTLGDNKIWFSLNSIRVHFAFASSGLKWERWEVTEVKVLHKASNTWKTFGKYLESIWKQLDWIEMQFYRVAKTLWRSF